VIVNRSVKVKEERLDRCGAFFCFSWSTGLRLVAGVSDLNISMRIVLAYSGGLDTSVLLSWIKEHHDAEMIAFCANIGQEEELKGLRAKALKTGAKAVHIVDLQEEFARDFIYPMMQAGAVYENQYFLGTSIARPLIAKGMIEVARREKADALAHGATGKGNDQVRFELTAAAWRPSSR
jgi:argininosuccinate synthase